MAGTLTPLLVSRLQGGEVVSLDDPASMFAKVVEPNLANVLT